MFVTFAAADVAAPGLHLDFTRGPIRDYPGRWRPLPVNLGLFTMVNTLAPDIRPLIPACIICTVCTCAVVLKSLVDLGDAYQRVTGSEWEGLHNASITSITH